MKGMFLDIEKAQKFCELKLANLKKKELPWADRWEVAQF